MKQCRTVGQHRNLHRLKPDRKGGCTSVVKLGYITLAVTHVIDRLRDVLGFP